MGHDRSRLLLLIRFQRRDGIFEGFDSRRRPSPATATAAATAAVTAFAVAASTAARNAVPYPASACRTGSPPPCSGCAAACGVVGASAGAASDV